MGKREGPDVWKKRVERLRASGLTDREFAAKVGVNIHTLRSWKSKLAKAGQSRAGRSATATAATFVELVAPLPQADLELIFGELRVRVPIGFDEGTLRRVLAVLEVKR